MRLPLVLIVSIGLFSCAHSPSSPEEAKEGEAVTRGETSQPATTPSTPAGEKLDWFLTTINEKGGKLSADEVEQNFSPTFLAQVPAQQLVTTFAQVSQGLAPLTLESVVEQSPNSLVARAASTQGPVRISLAVENEPPHRFDGLLIAPDVQQ